MTFHNLDVYKTTADFLGIELKTAIILITVIGIWTIIWKGFALWKSAKKNKMIWFIILLVVNTIGILEILYIYIFSELGNKKNKTHKKHRKK